MGMDSGGLPLGTEVPLHSWSHWTLTTGNLVRTARVTSSAPLFTGLDAAELQSPVGADPFAYLSSFAQLAIQDFEREREVVGPAVLLQPPQGQRDSLQCQPRMPPALQSTPPNIITFYCHIHSLSNLIFLVISLCSMGEY